MNPVKNIIFDLGNVLYDIDFTKMYQSFEELGIPHFETYFTLNQSDPLFFELEKGTINQTQFFEGFNKISPVVLSPLQITTAWNSLLMGYRKAAINWILENDRAYNIYLFSNTNQIHFDHFIPEFEREVADVPFQSIFKKAYFSHELGMRKPDPASFAQILENESLMASETLFIDDNKPNVEAAASLGMSTIHLTEGMKIHQCIFDYL
jgi:putative hydrolase of the HAD superfamily